MSPEVSIIIVSFNTKDLTLACIDSIINGIRIQEFEIIVIDNNSIDGSAKAIEKEFPQITVIECKENLGFALANNVAAKSARGERILLLNPDTVILEGAINELLSFADKTPEAKVWGGRAIDGDGKVSASCWNDISIWSLLCRAFGLTCLFPKSKFFNSESIHLWDSLQRDREVDIVSGCFLLIDRKIWNDLRGFNPKFFMYGEEVDLCLRARKKGAKPRVCSRATIIHYGGKSELSSEDKLVKLFRGRLTVIKEHWPTYWSFLGAKITVAGVALRAQFVSIFLAEKKKCGRKSSVNKWISVYRRRGEWSSGWN